MTTVSLLNSPPAAPYQTNDFVNAVKDVIAIKRQQLMEQNPDQYAEWVAKNQSTTGFNSSTTSGYSLSVQTSDVTTRMGASNPTMLNALSQNDKVWADAIAKRAEKQAANAAQEPGQQPAQNQDPSQTRENSLKAEHPFKPKFTRS